MDMKMQKLKCQIALSLDVTLNKFAGQTVTVTEIDRTCTEGVSGGFLTTCALEDGKHLRIWSEDLVPMDTSMVPPTHSTSRLLKNVWVFTEARNDACSKDQQPPGDLAANKEEYGHDWKDNRVFDVKRRRV